MIDFPAPPLTDGQLFEASNGISYRWSLANTAWLTAASESTGSGIRVLQDSPELTGDPTAPTPPMDDNDDSIATTAWVTGQGYAAPGGFLLTSGGTLSDPGDLTIEGTLTGTTADFSGIVTVPTAPDGNNSTRAATTAWVTSNSLSLTGGTVTGGASFSQAYAPTEPFMTNNVEIGNLTDWLQNYTGWFYINTHSSLVVRNPIGSTSIVGASRTEDGYDNTNAAIGVAGFGFQYDTASTQSAYGFYGQSSRITGAGPALAMELDAVELGTSLVVNPYTLSAAATGALSVAAWLASGGGTGMVFHTPIGDRTANAASAAIGITNNGARFNTGIVFHNLSLVGSDGANGDAGSAVAISLARSHNLAWFDSASRQTFSVGSKVTTTGPVQSLIATDTGIALTGAVSLTGALSATTGTFSGALTVNGMLTNAGGITVNGSVIHIDRLTDGTPADFYMTADAGFPANIILRGPPGVNRWVLRKNDTTETGSGNTGSDFDIRAYSDAGGLLGVALSIARATRITTFTVAPVAPGMTLTAGLTGTTAAFSGALSATTADLSNRLSIVMGTAGTMVDAAIFNSTASSTVGAGARIYLGCAGIGRSVYVEGVNTGAAGNGHDMVLGTSNNGALPVERLRITAAGATTLSGALTGTTGAFTGNLTTTSNLAVGTSVPGTRLEVSDDMNAAGFIRHANLNTGAASAVTFRQQTFTNRYVDRTVNYTSQNLHEIGTNIPNRFSDFDITQFRTSAGVLMLDLRSGMLTMTGTITSTGSIINRVGGAAASILFLDSDPDQQAIIHMRSSNATPGTRWLIGKSGAETGSGVGSDLLIYAYSDTGTGLGAALTINRAIAGAATVLAATFGGTVITPASAAHRAGLRIPHGVVPTTPVNGDMWTTTAGTFIRVNGVTKTFTVT